MANRIEVSLALSAMGPHVPKGVPLTERLTAAMRYAKAHCDELFWMSTPTDEDKFRVAVGAVLIDASAEEFDVIEKSLKPLKMLSAAMAGVPVAWDQFDLTPDGCELVPLIKLWVEA